MDQVLAERILQQWEVVEDFREPSDNVPDSVADAIYKRHDREREKLDALCMMALRQMAIDDARRALNMTPVHARE